jgi:enterochelin esterase-like enzyme
MDFVLGADEWDDPSKVAHNVDLFDTALRTEIIPQVEALYRASTRRGDRAIAGLSMGGGQSLVIGLEHPDVFRLGRRLQRLRRLPRPGRRVPQ